MNNLKLWLFFFAQSSAAILHGQDAVGKTQLTPEKREQHIQAALQQRKQENYTGAIRQLDSILAKQPADAPVMLFKGDLKLQAALFKEAAETYKALLPLGYESTIAEINLSYALFMNHQPAKALHHARAAWQKNKTNTNAIVNYFNAQLWNIQTKKAGEFLQQQQHLLAAPQVLVLQARLHTTNGNYNKGLHFYDSLVNSYPDKYYLQEYAEVLLGKKEMDKAASTMQGGKHYFSNSEYNAFTQKLKAARLQNAGYEFVYFKDVAKNLRIENVVWWQQGEGRVYRPGVRAGNASISSAGKDKTNTQFVHLVVAERWSKAWSGQTDVHLQRVQPAGGKGFTSVTGRQLLQYQPTDHRMFGLSYQADILNFTASLLQKNIRSNSLGYVTHIMLTGKTGFFSQGNWAVLSDNNQSRQFFGSIYHLIRTEPTIKTGINFSALHYADSSIKTYFSPNRYLSSEVFADYSTALPTISKFYLQMQGGAGMQKIEDQQWDPALRFQIEFGMRRNHLEASLKYQTSNVAAASGAGYKFNWFTFHVMWKW